MRETNPVVYVVDDDVSMRESVASLIRSADLAVDTFESPRELLGRCRSQLPSCLVLDVRLPGLSGLEVQQELVRMNVQVPIVFLTAHADIPTSVRAMKSGALEFLTKPFDGEALLTAIQEGITRRHAQPSKGRGERVAPELVGRSPRFEAVVRRTRAVAPTDATILITGETGTGKELIARSIHNRSLRSARPFVALNCGAIQPELMASELFGHERGAFTGAVQQRSGRFELADGGTLFLDEVGELSADAQVALLRVLQEREFERVGGSKTIRVDVRVIAATNRDLAGAIAEGTFRSDLFYRLNVFPVHLPPLRERVEDIPLLVEHFLRQRARVTGAPPRTPDERSMAMLVRHPWPGNIRELQSVLERWAILGGAEVPLDGRALEVPLDDNRTLFEPLIDEVRPVVASEPPVRYRDYRDAQDRTLIERTLEAVEGNHSEAARRLGMSRGALLGRLRKYRSRLEGVSASDT